MISFKYILDIKKNHNKKNLDVDIEIVFLISQLEKCLGHSGRMLGKNDKVINHLLLLILFKV